jgi:Family of unknown function (DUF6445)
MKTKLIIVDDFYSNPDQVRAFALSLQFEVSGNYPGLRTKPYLPDDLKSSIQYIVQNAGGRITNWFEESGYTGAFQICTAQDRTWVHADSYNTWAGVCYLTPDAPLSSGTALYRWKETKEYERADNNSPHLNGYDYTKWDLVDYVANKYNRIVLYRGNLYHASLDYFGDNLQNGRLFQTFFFNTEF